MTRFNVKMKKKSRFVLILSRQKIALGMKSNEGELQILDGFDPNEPAGNESLKRLFLLAKAIEPGLSPIEILLPKDVVQYETFISEGTANASTVREAIAKRKQVEPSSIQVTLGESLGSRTTSIAFIENEILNELKVFITKAGFQIRSFLPHTEVVGFKKGQELFTETRSVNNNFLSIQPSKYLAMASALILLGFLFYAIKDASNKAQDLNTYLAPEVTSEIQAHSPVEQYVVSDPLRNSAGSHSFNANTAMPDLEVNLPMNFKASPTNKLDHRLPNNLDQKNSSSILIKVHFNWPEQAFKAPTMIPNHIVSTDENVKAPRIHLNPKNWSSVANDLLQISRLSPETTILKEIRGLDFNISSEKKKEKPKLQVSQKKKKSNGDSLQRKRFLEIYIKAENEDAFPELSTNEMELASKINPPPKPKSIDLARILTEPTLSSGALFYTQPPVMRPEVVTLSKKVQASTVNIKAKATRSPSIPERASVGHNATKRNFIDLDRTNLIGIFGKSEAIGCWTTIHLIN